MASSGGGGGPLGPALENSINRRPNVGGVS